MAQDRGIDEQGSVGAPDLGGDPGMADKKITPKAAASKEKDTAGRAAARVSQKKTAKKLSAKRTRRTLKKV
jgi:hypothetical protein